MKEKVMNIVMYPFTPIICFVLGLVVSELSVRSSESGMGDVLTLILGVVGVISTVVVIEKKFWKVLLIFLFIVMILVAGKGIARMGSGRTGMTDGGNAYIKGDTSDVTNEGFDVMPVNQDTSGEVAGGGKDKKVDTLSKCTYCGGTGHCEKCCGTGENLCSCLGGSCPTCSGIGHKMVYTKDGLEYPDCRTCGGSGAHERCDGTGFLQCTPCGGTGECPYCGGSGEK